jgi:hypothetical protein
MNIGFRYGDSHTPRYAKEISDNFVVFNDELLKLIRQ